VDDEALFLLVIGRWWFQEDNVYPWMALEWCGVQVGFGGTFVIDELPSFVEQMCPMFLLDDGRFWWLKIVVLLHITFSKSSYLHINKNPWVKQERMTK